MTREEASRHLHNDWYIENGHLCVYENARDLFLEAVGMGIKALRPISRERVEKVWSGEWKHYLPPLGAGDVQCRCTRCGRTPDVETPFCAWCGAPMTDEAVQMVMERMEELHENIHND